MKTTPSELANTQPTGRCARVAKEASFDSAPMVKPWRTGTQLGSPAYTFNSTPRTARSPGGGAWLVSSVTKVRTWCSMFKTNEQVQLNPYTTRLAPYGVQVWRSTWRTRAAQLGGVQGRLYVQPRDGQLGTLGRRKQLAEVTVDKRRYRGRKHESMAVRAWNTCLTCMLAHAGIRDPRTTCIHTRLQWPLPPCAKKTMTTS